MKVLLVEDSADMRVLVKEKLNDMGISQIVEADNGSEAYHKALLQKFDLVISDVKMPVMDGIGLLQVLRTIRGFSRVPCLLMSADDVHFNERIIEDKAFSFIAKPVSTQDLVMGVSEASKLDAEVARKMTFLWNRTVFQKLSEKVNELLRTGLSVVELDVSAETLELQQRFADSGLLISLNHALGKSMLLVSWNESFIQQLAESLPYEHLMNVLKQDLLESWHQSLSSLGEQFEYQMAMLNRPQLQVILQPGAKGLRQDFTWGEAGLSLYLLKF